MVPRQRLGTGVAPASLGLMPDKGTPASPTVTATSPETATEAVPAAPPEATVPLIEDVPPHTTPTGAAPVTSGAYLWDPYPSHERNYKEPGLRRKVETHVKVFDLSKPDDCQAYGNLLLAEGGHPLHRKEGLNNRVRFRSAPVAYPPDPGNTNVRIMAAWEVYEYVLLDPRTGVPIFTRP